MTEEEEVAPEVKRLNMVSELSVEETESMTAPWFVIRKILVIRL